MLWKPFREFEPNSSEDGNKTRGSRVYLYRPNLPEGCIGVPDQCIGFLVKKGACRENIWGELIRYSSPRCREISGGIEYV